MAWLRSLVILAVLGAPAFAAAQTSMNVRLIDVTGRSDTELSGTDPLINTPVSAEECDPEGDVEIEIQLDNIPTDEAVLDFWLASGNQNCADPANRDDTKGNTACDHLDPSVDRSIGGVGSRTLKMPLRELLDVDGDGECDSGREGNNTVYILAVATSNSMDEAGASWTLPIALNTVPPDAPTSVTGGSGDSQIKVSWHISNAEQIREQNIYYLPGGCVNGQFTGGEADGGGDSDAGDSDGGVDGWKRAKSGISGTVRSASLVGFKLGLEDGDEAAVAVTTIDKAGNESPRSEPACIQRFVTEGYCALVRRKGGKCESCSVSQVGGPASFGLGAMAFGLAMSILVARRRRG